MAGQDVYYNTSEWLRTLDTDAILGVNISTYRDVMIMLNSDLAKDMAVRDDTVIILRMSDAVEQRIEGSPLRIIPPNSLLLIDADRTPRPGDLSLAAEHDDMPLILQDQTLGMKIRLALIAIIFPRRDE